MVIVQESKEPLEEPAGVGDYFVLYAEGTSWYLSVEMARAVDRDLAASPLPGWTVFVDIAGSRIRVRTRRIEYLIQCSADQRAARREFHRRLRQERDADRAWDEDD
jgi:hypothetical protein